MESGSSGRGPSLGTHVPFFGMAGIAFAVFLTSRKRPGETPVGRAMEAISNIIARFKPKRAGTPA